MKQEGSRKRAGADVRIGELVDEILQCGPDAVFRCEGFDNWLLQEVHGATETAIDDRYAAAYSGEGALSGAGLHMLD